MLALEGKPKIVALRNEKGSYSYFGSQKLNAYIVALRNEKGSYSMLGLDVLVE